jgi:hypothetical protein
VLLGLVAADVPRREPVRLDVVVALVAGLPGLVAMRTDVSAHVTADVAACVTVALDLGLLGVGNVPLAVGAELLPVVRHCDSFL